MALYRINAQLPGAYVEGFGLIPSGETRSLPDDVPPQRSFQPLDDAAVKAFENWNKAVLAHENVEIEAEIQKRIELGTLDEKRIDSFRKKHLRKPNIPITPKKKAPNDAVRRAERELERARAEQAANESDAEIPPDPAMKVEDPEDPAPAGKAKGPKRASDSE